MTLKCPECDCTRLSAYLAPPLHFIQDDTGGWWSKRASLERLGYAEGNFTVTCAECGNECTVEQAKR